MELIWSGVLLQVLAILLLVLLSSGAGGRTLLVRLRVDGRADQAPDDAAVLRRRQLLRGAIALFLGGATLALLGVPRL